MSNEILKNKEKPNFESIISREVKNFKTGEVYKLNGGEEMSFSDIDVENLVSICSQEEIYDFLFRARFNNRPYSQSDAEGFLKYIKDGWENKTHFVFLIRNSDNKIIGAVDIKSSNLDDSEIGYWADRNHGGFMANAVSELCLIAKDTGYKKLNAKVRPDNNKSSSVLIRNGFENVGTSSGYSEGIEYALYEKDLEI